MSDYNNDEEIRVLFLGGSNFLQLARMLYYYFDIYLTYVDDQSAKFLNPEFYWVKLGIGFDFKANLQKIIENIRPRFIVNFISPVELKDPNELSYQLNINPNSIIIDLCRSYSIHPILISSDDIWDGLKGPYSEDSPINPVQGFAYGEERAKAESIFLAMVNEGKASIVRTSTLLGFTEPYLKQSTAPFLDILDINQRLLNGEIIRGAINKYRTPSHIYNLGFILSWILSKDPNESSNTGIFHIPGYFTNEFDLFQAIAKSLEFNTNLVKSFEILNTSDPYPLKTGLNSNNTDVTFLNFSEGLALLADQIQKQNSK